MNNAAVNIFMDIYYMLSIISLGKVLEMDTHIYVFDTDYQKQYSQAHDIAKSNYISTEFIISLRK